MTYDEADEFAAQTVDVEAAEPEVYEIEPEVEGPAERQPIDDEAEASKPLWQRLASLIVPIGVVLYIVISALANNSGG